MEERECRRRTVPRNRATTPFFASAPQHTERNKQKNIYIITIITNERCWSGSRGRQHGQIAIFPAPTHFSASIYFVSSCRRKMQTSNEEVIESQQAIRKKRKEKKRGPNDNSVGADTGDGVATPRFHTSHAPTRRRREITRKKPNQRAH